MDADEQVCTVCGAAISAERRLVRTSRGSWTVVEVPVGCTNPLCPNAPGKRTAPPGPASLVA